MPILIDVPTKPNDKEFAIILAFRHVSKVAFITIMDFVINFFAKDHAVGGAYGASTQVGKLLAEM